MRAGTLRKVGWLQQRSQTRDNFGGLPPSWVDVCKIRYEFQISSARELDSAGNVRAVAISTVTMRWQDGILPGMRIRGEQTDREPQKFFNITAVNDINQKHHELELTVLEDRTAVP
jgi:head-tail adaptor